MRRRLAPFSVAVLAAALPLAAAGTAAADSIVFVKDHNVWIAQPDGSGARAVTSDGTSDWPYRSPAQADDGTIAAGRGTDIVQLDQQGTRLAMFEPYRPENSASFHGLPPQDVALSPDGSKVAYTFYGYSCLPGASCGTRQLTGYMSADGEQRHGHEFSLTGPEWVSSEEVLGFGGYGRSVNFDRIGSGDYDARLWFNDPSDEDLADGELSRDGERLALLRSYGEGQHLQVLAAAGRDRAPEPICSTGADSTLNDPSWSPDGGRIAVETGRGIEVLAVSPGAAGCGASSVAIPGGSEPDWGPAEVQPRYELSADVARGTTLRKALRKGLRLDVQTSVAGTLSGALLVAKKRVASGSAELAPGAGAITFRFTKSAQRGLAKRRKVAIFVDLTFRPRSGAPFPVSGTVEVRR